MEPWSDILTTGINELKLCAKMKRLAWSNKKLIGFDEWLTIFTSENENENDIRCGVRTSVIFCRILV